tara:strand:- start:23 stop:1225 length:1203 start_codon:yes stop_codon:yes gene_type:complete
MKNQIIGLVTATNNLDIITKNNLDSIHSFSKKFDKFYLFNFINLKLFHKNTKLIRSKQRLPKNFIIKTFKNKQEALHFFNKKKLISILHLGKSLEHFPIYSFLQKIKSKSILVLNLGNYGNTASIDFSFKFFFKRFEHFYDKGFYYLFRILTIINVFPKVDFYFESDLDIIKTLNKGFSKKFDKKFNFLKISYFKKIIKVNSKAYDYILKNKIENIDSSYIIFIDTPIDHVDRTSREGNISLKNKETYYTKLNFFLFELSKLLKKKIIICPHPKMKNPKSVYPNFTISKKRTIEMIPRAKLVIFTLSSAISLSIILKKKIFCIQSKLLGDYYTKLSNKYIDALNLKKINIDDKFLLKKKDVEINNKSLRLYKKFVSNKLKVDGNISSDKRIIDTIIKNYF